MNTNAQEKLIVALDVSTYDEMTLLVEELMPHVGCFKIGSEVITSIGGPQTAGFIHSQGGKVFYDGKFNDTPRTIAQASRAVAELGVAMYTVHCLSGSEVMKTAREAVNTAVPVDETIMVNRSVLSPPLILGVTLLTSLDYGDLVEMGIFKELNIADENELKRVEREAIESFAVRHLAWLAQENGFDGVTASPCEAAAIREYCGADLTIVTPGIRPVWAAGDDQKRSATPAEALRNGADYLVVGRPIIKPPKEVGTPTNAALRILEEIDKAL